MKLAAVTVGPFRENSYLLADKTAGECVLIDPGDEWRRIADMVRECGCALSAVWLTHAHLDHIGAVAGIKRLWNVPVYLHPGDIPLYERAHLQAAAYGISFEVPPPPDAALRDDQLLVVGSHEFRVMHTPGHSPGHVVFVGDEFVLCGDLIFLDSIGRTDLPLSSPADMSGSLERIAGLSADLALHPGHGPATTIRRELTSNPFLNGMARVVGG